MTDFDSREEARRLRWEARKKKWEARMERHAYRDQAPGHSHIWTGLFLLLIGGVSLVKSFGAPLPPWVFSWQMLLIVIGLFIGFRRGFDHGGWMVPILIGLVFMLNDYFLDGSLRHHVWPLVLIAIGIFFIIRPRRRYRWHYRWGVHNNPLDEKKSTDMNTEDRTGESAENFSQDDVVDATSIFGGTKK